MEALASDAVLGGAGVTIGGVGLVMFIRAVMLLGRFGKSFELWLSQLTDSMKDASAHFKAEESHHKRMVQHYTRVESLLERMVTPGVPYQVPTDPTPIHSPPMPPAIVTRVEPQSR